MTPTPDPEAAESWPSVSSRVCRRGSGSSREVGLRRIGHVKASAQEPQARGGRVLAEQALAGKARCRAAGRSLGAGL